MYKTHLVSDVVEFSVIRGGGATKVHWWRLGESVFVTGTNLDTNETRYLCVNLMSGRKDLPQNNETGCQEIRKRGVTGRT